MNIGLVLPGFSAHARDWCIPALRHLARSLATTDDVRVVATRYPYRPARYSVDGVEAIAVGGALSRGVLTLDVWRKALSVLTDEHRRRPFDVLHAFWATESGLLAAIAGRWLRVPTLVSLAGGELVALPEINYGDQRIAWERIKIRGSLRLASQVSVGSRYLRTLAMRHVAAQKLRHAPLGVPLREFAPASSPPSGEPRITHVGALTPVKDQALLLRAFAHVRRHVPGARLDLAGDGPLRVQLERLACQLAIGERVSFHGDIDHAALPGLYRSGLVFVLPSRHEAQGMVAIEAAACGSGIVGTRVGVVPELATTGDLVPVGATEALAETLVEALVEPTSRRRTALERATADFDLEVCTARFRALYQELIRS